MKTLIENVKISTEKYTRIFNFNTLSQNVQIKIPIILTVYSNSRNINIKLLLTLTNDISTCSLLILQADNINDLPQFQNKFVLGIETDDNKYGLYVKQACNNIAIELTNQGIYSPTLYNIITGGVDFGNEPITIDELNINIISEAKLQDNVFYQKYGTKFHYLELGKECVVPTFKESSDRNSEDIPDFSNCFIFNKSNKKIEYRNEQGIWYKTDGSLAETLEYGTIENIPSNGDVPIGYKYLCTNINSPESAGNGVLCINTGSSWIDSLGRDVLDNYPTKYEHAVSSISDLNNLVKTNGNSVFIVGLNKPVWYSTYRLKWFYADGTEV